MRYCGFSAELRCLWLSLPHTHMREGIKKSVLSVSQSVCLSSQHIYWVKQLLYVAMTWQSKCMVYLIETKTVYSSTFPALFYLTLDCPPFWSSQPLGYNWDWAYADSKHVFAFTGFRKAGRGAGNEAIHPLGWLGMETTIWLHGRMLLRRLDEVVSSWDWSFYFMRPVGYSMKLVSK